MAKATVLSLSPVAQAAAVVLGMQADWRIVEPLLGGTRAMRNAGESLLPKFEKEPQKTYNRRKDTSTLFPAYGRTVSTLTGKPFSRPITVPDALPEDWKTFFGNVDLQNANLGVFAADLFYNTLGRGLGGIVVDCPVRPEGLPNSVAAEKEAGIRPYFVQIAASDLLGWKATLKDGQWKLTQVRFFEYVDEDKGDYGTVCVKQIRVWNIGKYEIWRETENKPGDWYMFKGPVPVSIDFVPYVPFYGRRRGFMHGSPPLMDLAYLNVKHWQSQSDQDNILHVARVPILMVQTDDETFEMSVGSGIGMRVPVNCDAKYIEHTGKAIEAGAKSLAELKDEMRQAGAELLVMRMTEATATEIASDNSVGTCELQRMTVDFESSLNSAIEMAAKWIGQESPGEVKLFKEFGALTVADASAQILLESANSGKLSDQTFFKELQRRGIIAPELQYDDEKKLIAAQPKPEPVVSGGGNPNDPTNKPQPTSKPPLQ